MQDTDLLIPYSEVIEEGDDDEEEEEEIEVVKEDDDDETVGELLTRTVDVAGIVGNNTDVVFIGGAILAVIVAFGEISLEMLTFPTTIVIWNSRWKIWKILFTPPVPKISTAT